MCRKNPDKQIEVEINYPLGSKEYAILNNTLHKSKIFPNIKIVDNLMENDDKFEFMEDYNTRSLFLRNFHDIACYAMGYCQRRGADKNIRRSWNYLCDIGLITSEECQQWQEYTDFRNELAHKHFDADLRKKLNDINEKFIGDFISISKKMYDTEPNTTKIKDDIFKYECADGKVVTLDYASHRRTISKQATENKKHQKERFDNGIEFKINKGKIVGIKFPNEVYINMVNRSITIGKTRWYSNSKYFNVLQTGNNIIRTDKELKVMSFLKGNNEIPFTAGDILCVDGYHDVLLDEKGKIKGFNFINTENKVVEIQFKHIKSLCDLISFTDGTNILLSDEGVTITHNKKVLNYNNREEFAATYNTISTNRQQFTKTENIR